MHAASGVTAHSLPPKPSTVVVTDLFQVLGPLATFSAVNSWSPPRSITLNTHSTSCTSIGLCIGKSHPVVVTSVEPGGIAQVDKCVTLYV